MLIDTHCHIHESDYPLPVSDVIRRSHEAGVDIVLCVGTSEVSSVEAVAFAAKHKEAYAVVGVHPHDAKDGYDTIRALIQSVELENKIVGVGEIGLDYFYTHSPRDVQIQALEEQLQVALEADLPVSFHVREAFEDFWPILDTFHGVRGVLHSFTDSMKNLEKGLEKGLYMGVNGISTFTKDSVQKEMFATIPLDRIILETDAPFLTPSPFRGKINEPAFVKEVAQFQAAARGLSLEDIATITTANARALFAL